MALIQKYYKYSIFRNSVYLGDLQNVTSDFTFSQDINAAGSQTVITVAQSADTSALPNSELTDESGNILTDESGNSLWTDGVPPNVGSYNDATQIRNGNNILIYEYSALYPNGKLMFTGYISTWEAHFGGNDDEQITITALSGGSDLGNYLIGGGFTEVIEQDTANATYNINTLANGYELLGNTFIPGASYNLGRIDVKMVIDPVAGAAPCTLVMTLYSGAPNGALTPIVSVTTSTTLTSAGLVQFIFPQGVALTSGVTYTWAIEPIENSVNFSYANTQPYAQMWGYNGSAWYTVAGSMTFDVYSTSDLTQIQYTSTDPTVILAAIIASYHGAGGNVNTAAGSTVNTGLSVTYTFNANSVLEGIQALLTLAGGTYYWYADLATQVLYFKPTATTAAYVLTKGKHLTSVILKATIENIINNVYFTGGKLISGFSLFVNYLNTTSIANNNGVIGMDRISDTNVTDNFTGNLLAQNDSSYHPNEEYQTQVTILDQTMDITLPKPGDTIGFSGFGTFVDGLLLQITRIDYTPEQLTLTLGTKPPRTHSSVQNIKNELLQLQQVNNPTAPT